jgi:hypothetical protein
MYPARLCAHYWAGVFRVEGKGGGGRDDVALHTQCFAAMVDRSECEVQSLHTKVLRSDGKQGHGMHVNFLYDNSHIYFFSSGASVVFKISESPASKIVITDTLKYLPHAVPSSTLLPLYEMTCTFASMQ